MFRHKVSVLEVLLVHPDGPFFAKKDEGAWTIPKVRPLPAKISWYALKLNLKRNWELNHLGIGLKLGSIKQKGGKIVHAWAFEGDLPDSFKLKSNTFDMEWPPHSGKRQRFSEIDQAAFFSEEVARRKINPAQVVLLDRLRAALDDNEQR